MNKTLAGIVGILCFGAAVGLMLSGCEETTGRALTVTPTTASLTGTSNSVVFAVSTNSLRDLSLPLEWRVTNPGLGSINSVGGMSAIYQPSGAAGDNIIIVRDQYGAEGMATVNQQ